MRGGDDEGARETQRFASGGGRSVGVFQGSTKEAIARGERGSGVALNGQARFIGKEMPYGVPRATVIDTDKTRKKGKWNAGRDGNHSTLKTL